MKCREDIDAILFDMMGVLLFKRDGYIKNQLVDKIDNLIGTVTNDQTFKKDVLKKFHLEESELNDILTKIVDKYRPLESLWSLLPELKRCYKLAIINNGTALTLPGFDKKLDFDKHFDLFVSSAQEGLKKPDNEIFITTTKRLNVDLKRCLFMDDSEQNIQAAKRIGMKTILWDNKEQGFKEFTKLINA